MTPGRAAVGRWAAALLLAAGGAHAQAIDERATQAGWAAPCVGVPAPAPRLRARVSDETLRYNDPMQALARACARLARGDVSFAARLSLAEALLLASRSAAARGVLEAIAAAPPSEPVDAADLELAWVDLARDAGQHATAEIHAERALALLAPLPPQAGRDQRARALIARAAVARALNKPQAQTLATAALDEAQALIQQTSGSNSYRMGDIYNQRTMLAHARENLAETIRWATAERDLMRRLGGRDAPAQLHALSTLAAVTSQQRDYAASVRHLEDGRRIGRQAPAASQRAFLGILNTLTYTLSDLGQPQAAYEVATEAVALAVAGWGANSQNLLTPLSQRSYAEAVLQRHVDARRSHEQILAILRREGAQTALARRMRLIDSAAEFYAYVNDFESAQRLVDEGLALVPEGAAAPYWRGRMLRRAAILAGYQQRWAEADAWHEQARPLLQRSLGADHPYLTSTDIYRCEAQLRQQLEPRACSDVAAGLDGLRRSGPNDRVRARRVLAQQALAEGRDEPAFDHLLHALAAAQSLERGGAVWRALDDIAGRLRERGQPRLAVLLAKRAVQAIEAVRHQFLDPAQLNAMAQDNRQAVYRRLADWLAEDGRADEALEVFGLLKADEYGAFVDARSNSAAARGSATLSWTAAERQWLAASPLAAGNAAARTRPAAALDPPPTVERVTELESARVQAWRSALQTPLPTESAGATPKPVALAAGDLMATLFMGRRHLNIVLHSRFGQRLVRVETDPQALSRDIGALLEGLGRREAMLPQLRSLFERVAAPLAEESRRSGTLRWLLRLDGDLRYLPMAALHDGSAHLVQRYTIVQQSSSVVGSAPGRPRAAFVNAFGSTRAAPGLAALPGVQAEICAIVDGPVDDGTAASPCVGGVGVGGGVRGAVAGQAWLDQAFTQQALRKAAASGQAGRLDLLHIGTHFVLRPGEIGLSWMQLGDGQRLPLSELLTWSLGSQDVVTLSACQTGLGGGGGELEGLSTLLLQRGAGAVIASLWPVDDRSTGVLMQQMYRRIRAGEEPAAALRQAQLQALAETARNPAARLHPFHWAGFFLSTGRR